jgi:hypothetical protein
MILCLQHTNEIFYTGGKVMATYKVKLMAIQCELPNVIHHSNTCRQPAC